jgi:predicted thioesterase
MIHHSLFAEVEATVGERDTASHIGIAAEDEFPKVFATSRMIALMEVAAARAMRPMLTPGQLSVGVALDVHHTAATAVGSTVRAAATYLRSDSRLLYFKVEAFDESGPIGHGEHTRVIVDGGRLLAGAERRRSKPPPPAGRQATSR